MKRLSKILMLVLVISLTCTLFGIFSGAAGELTGVSSTLQADGAIGQNVLNQGSNLAIETVGGNKYREWTVYNPSALVPKTDTQIRFFPSFGSYYVFELDIASRTVLPEGFGFAWTVNGYNATFTGTGELGTTDYFFKAVDGKLTIGGKNVPAVEGSDWNHITIVVDFNPVAATYENPETGATVEYTDYSATVANVYADGVLMHTFQPFATLGRATGTRRAYLGYKYNDGVMKNSVPGASIAMDNVVQTTCTSAYVGSDDASLADLFGEGAITNLADYAGAELAYKAGYQYPASDLGLLYVDDGMGTKYPFGSLQKAIDAVANNEVFGDIYLLADEQNPAAHVTVPVTIYTNGYAIINVPTYGEALTADVSADAYVYELVDDTFQVDFYDGTFEQFEEEGLSPRTSFYFTAGEAVVDPAWADNFDPATKKATVYSGWKIYDENMEFVGTDLALIDGSCGYYFVFAEKTVTDVLFYTESAGVVTYYSNAADFTPANISGKKTVLVSDVVFSTPLTGGANIDLNGNTLVATAHFSTSGSSYVYNTSVNGAAIYVSAGTFTAGESNQISVGYNGGNKVDGGRIFVTCQAFGGGKDCYQNFYNCDIVNVNGTNARRGSWRGGANLRGGLRFENCDIYLPIGTQFIHSNGLTTADALSFKNCNIYAAAGGAFTGQQDKTGNPTATFDNSAVYGAFDWVWYSDVYTWNITGGSKFNTAINLASYNLPQGYWAATKTESKEISFTYAPSYGADPVTFTHTLTTSYVVEKAPTQATFKFFDKAYDDPDVAAAVELSSQVKYLGETAIAPNIPGVYDDLLGKAIVVDHWEVYNSLYQKLGNLEDTLVTNEMDLQTFYVYPVFVEKDVAFCVVNGEELTFFADVDFIPANVDGKKVVLLSDISTDKVFTNVNINLNGFALISTGSYLLLGNANYIYNESGSQARLGIQNALMPADQASTSRAVYIGYTNASTKLVGGGRITMNVLATSTAIFGGKNNNTAKFYNVDYVNTVARDVANDSQVLFYQQLRSMAVEFDNCNFYAVEPTALIGGNQATPGGFYVKITNSNFYGNMAIFGGVSNWKAGDATTATFENVHFYNGARIFGNGASMTFKDRVVPNCDANCTFSTGVSVATHVLPEGMTFVLNANAKETINFTYITANGEAGVFEGVFESGIAVGTAEQLSAQFKSFYRNVAIDVDINFNLYVPTTYSIAVVTGATKNGTTTIGGVEYYVLTVKQAPKNAYAAGAIDFGGIVYSADVVDYAGALLRLSTDTDYVKDSKAMVKYVLHYIRTTAVAANAEADVSAIDALLTGFAISAADKTLTEGTANTALLSNVFAESYLDLKSQTGIVFKVKPGFVGEITVTMAGIDPITRAYATAAGEDEYIVVGGIPAYDFRNMITITVDGTIVGNYNLATYVKNVGGDVAYATYAYSKAAASYHAKYGNPTTTD